MGGQSPVTSATHELRKTAIGMWMTVLYLVIYSGYVAVSVFRPAWMGVPGIFGLNLATAYGIGLIIFAVALAIVYNYLVRFRDISASETNAEEEHE
jgi:uncharacterized membrane protein (DUF485 family)